MGISRKLSALGALFVLAGGANATCNVSGVEAVSVQVNQGQGEFTCADVLSPSGQPVVDLGSWGLVTISLGAINKTLKWDLDLSGLPFGQTYPVYLVRAVNNGQGNSCNYAYDGITTSDDRLGNTSAGGINLSATKVCGSLDPVALPVEPEPVQVIDTALGACDTKIEAGNTLLATQQATFGYSLNDNGSRTFSACGNTKDDGGLSPDGTTGQVRCTPPEYVAQDPLGICMPNADGELPLSCAPVNVDAAPADGPEYCWFYENKVCRDGANVVNPFYCEGRTPGTFIVKNLKDTVNAQFNVFEGSTCITQIFYGIAYHTCW